MKIRTQLASLIVLTIILVSHALAQNTSADLRKAPGTQNAAGAQKTASAQNIDKSTRHTYFGDHTQRPPARHRPPASHSQTRCRRRSRSRPLPHQGKTSRQADLPRRPTRVHQKLRPHHHPRHRGRHPKPKIRKPLRLPIREPCSATANMDHRLLHHQRLQKPRHQNRHHPIQRQPKKQTATSARYSDKLFACSPNITIRSVRRMFDSFASTSRFDFIGRWYDSATGKEKWIETDAHTTSCIWNNDDSGGGDYLIAFAYQVNEAYYKGHFYSNSPVDLETQVAIRYNPSKPKRHYLSGLSGGRTPLVLFAVGTGFGIFWLILHLMSTRLLLTEGMPRFASPAVPLTSNHDPPTQRRPPSHRPPKRLHARRSPSRSRRRRHHPPHQLPRPKIPTHHPHPGLAPTPATSPSPPPTTSNPTRPSNSPTALKK